MKLVFLDTETTGTDEEDRLCQVAYRCDGKDWNDYFKPPLPIKVMAMSICHITNKMVEDKEAFEGSEMAQNLQRLLDEGAVLVAHNAKFDIKMLEKEGIKVPKFICTMKVSQSLDVDAVIPSYKLQYLRYMLGLEIEADAHDALGDILVMEGLFNRLKQKITVEEMLEISGKPLMVKKFLFGKHVGKMIADVAEIKPARNGMGYLQWLLGEKRKNEPDDEDWIYTLEHYVEGKK